MPLNKEFSLSLYIYIYTLKGIGLQENLFEGYIYMCEFGKHTISFWIEKYPETLHPRLNKNFITEGIELIRNNNSFQSNSLNYIQTFRTAMGTKMEPTYTTLTFAYLEENLYEILGKTYNNNIKTEFTESWRAYLDDCFIFWKCP